MPSTAIGRHPSGRTITFTESDHSYIDDSGHHYTSGTAVVKRCFKPFDAVAVSESIAESRGTTPEVLRAEWEKKRDYACEVGTRVHENCEAQLMGKPLVNRPRDERENGLMTQAWHAANKLLELYVPLAVELIVFSPRYYVAGTIDALLQDRRDGSFLIADWKTNEKLRKGSFNGDFGVGAGFRMPDCELSRYSLQMSVYERILRSEQYVASNAVVNRLLIHLTETGFNGIPTSYLRAESAEALLDVCTEVPF